MHSAGIDGLARGLTIAIVFLVLSLVRRFVPAEPPKTDQSISLDELDSRFASTKSVVYGGMVVLGLAMGFGLYFALRDLNRYLATLDGPVEFVLYPESATWWFLPMFGALALSWEVTLGIWSLFGDRREVALFGYWISATAGFNSTKVLRVIALVLVLPIAIFTALALPMHEVLSDSVIVSRGYAFSGAHVFAYSSARRMTVIEGFRNRDGSLTRRAAVVIDFADGRRWSSQTGDFKSSVDPAMLNFLEEKTALTPHYAETEADIPAPR
jgi:hypothetical protein